MEQLSKVSRSWSKEEDDKLRRQINAEANQNWKSVATKAGLKRTANSCRLRFVNHVKPRPRPGKLTVEEKLLILEFRNQYGKNRWAEIAKHLRPGRRDNDVKNYWHSLAKRARREGRDVDGYASRKRAELVEKIKAAGKFSMDYSSSISADAFEKLKELFPDIAAAGGGAVAEVAASSSFTGAVALASDVGISNDLASSSAATDIGAADAVTSCYSVEFGPGRAGYGDFSYYSWLVSSDASDLPEEMFPDIAGGAADSSPTDGELDAGTPGRVDHTVFSPYVATTEVDQLTPYVETPQSRVAVERQFQKGFTARFFYYGGDPGAAPGSDSVPEAEPGNFYSIVPVQVQQHHQLVKTGLFHPPTGFNKLPAALGIASTETSNQTLIHMQVTSPEYSDPITNTFDVAQQYHEPVEQQGLNGSCLDHGGGPIGLNEAMAAAAALSNTTSNEIDSACSSAEEELDENKAFADYFNFDDF